MVFAEGVLAALASSTLALLALELLLLLSSEEESTSALALLALDDVVVFISLLDFDDDEESSEDSPVVFSALASAFSALPLLVPLDDSPDGMDIIPLDDLVNSSFLLALASLADLADDVASSSSTSAFADFVLKALASTSAFAALALDNDDDKSSPSGTDIIVPLDDLDLLDFAALVDSDFSALVENVVVSDSTFFSALLSPPILPALASSPVFFSALVDDVPFSALLISSDLADLALFGSSTFVALVDLDMCGMLIFSDLPVFR
mmetsp:Transcript_12116/g.26124  ORF Transcript_12116/g.26124 Transcript_12116/m.26124 type:complete len:265 (-) Transcript_12116:2375-3169(-)